MATHDMYDNNILKQLTSIAKSLVRIDKRLADIRKPGDLVQVTRCKDCKYYISDSDMKNNPEYKDYDNKLEADGLCTSTDTWTDETDYCSNCKKRED